jgi:hypothetical protein
MSNDVVSFNQNSLANLSEELQLKILAYSQKIQEGATVNVSKIRLDAKSYIFPDGTETQTFSGIIISSLHANMRYPDYEEGKINPPDCIALGTEACKDLKPHESVDSPYNSNCGNCPKFQWGSAEKGRGKACSEYTLLAVYVPAMGDDLFLVEQKKANSRIADTYLLNATKKFGHTISVLTKFTMGEKTKWEQSLVTTDPVNMEMITKLAERFEEAETILKARVIDAYRKEDTGTASEVTDEPVRQARSR